MDLGGQWLAVEADDERRRRLPDPDLDDRSWELVEVPGQWRAHPAFAASDGPLLYRRHFTAESPADDERAWLTFEGFFYQADVWLDGSYLGDTEGYFAPATFEVTDQLATGAEHLLAVEVACTPPDDRRRKRALTGVFQHWDCLDPAWNPGGIWAPVRIDRTGPTRLAGLRCLCREATAERAVIELEAAIEAPVAGVATVRTAIRRAGETVAAAGETSTTAGQTPAGELVAESDDARTLAAGSNRVRWRVPVERPDLWWPHALGGQPLYEVAVEIRCSGGDPSDGRTLTTGLRRFVMKRWIATVNGERLYLKGANLAPTRRALSEVRAEDVATDLALARDAGLDLLRVHAHVGHPLLYEEADRTGMLLWQDLPLQWGYGQVRRQAVRQARQAVDVLGHHPAIALWCGHNEPLAIDAPAGGAFSARQIARAAAGHAFPTWNKTALDRSIRRTLERADGSRPVVAHSGILPHPAWGTDTHAYFGWYHGDERDLPAVLARLPVLGRFVSEFGAQAVPDSDEFLDPERWPDLDWDRLQDHHALQKSVFDRRVPPGDFATFDDWRQATQRYQAEVVRYHVETLRRLKYRPGGGFCVFLFADAQPAVSWALLDHQRVPKLAYEALRAACSPLIVVADRLRPDYAPGDEVAVAVHAVSDLRRAVPGVTATVDLRWPAGGHRRHLAGDVPADSCTLIGRFSTRLPVDAPAGPLVLSVELAGPGAGGAPIRSRYTSRVTGPPRSTPSATA